MNHHDTHIKIKGRVIKKSELRQFRRKNDEEGYVFNIVILDKTRSIMATFYNDVAAKYYPIVKEKEVYSFSDF